jgi:hypothetical protein
LFLITYYFYFYLPKSADKINFDISYIPALVLLIVSIFFVFDYLGNTISDHDYIVYVRQWRDVINGDNPWAGKRSAYGPGHYFIALIYNIYFDLPRYMFVGLWLLTCFEILTIAYRNSKLPLAHKHILAALLLFNPFFWIIVARFGINDIFMTYCVITSLIFYRLKRHVLSGVLLGLGVSIKFIPFVMVPFLVLSNRQIKWKFALSCAATLFLIFAVSYLLWGDGFLRAFSFGANRPSTNLSIFRFLRGDYSPMHLFTSHPDYDKYSVMITLLLLFTFFIIHVKYNINPLVSSVISFGILLLLYKVGNHQFYTTFFFLVALLVCFEYEKLASRESVIFSLYIFLIWISMATFFYLFTHRYINTDWRHIIGLPTFILGSFSLGLLIKNYAIAPVSEKQDVKSGM